MVFSSYLLLEKPHHPSLHTQRTFLLLHLHIFRPVRQRSRYDLAAHKQFLLKSYQRKGREQCRWERCYFVWDMHTGPPVKLTLYGGSVTTIFAFLPSINFSQVLALVLSPHMSLCLPKSQRSPYLLIVGSFKASSTSKSSSLTSLSWTLENKSSISAASKPVKVMSNIPLSSSPA